ncbi:hypothetical protein JW868_04300 [Candidatus Woesearchaeota archaeon]|nr:hypothetical protein [Candidatus Woesearchaeota archaeon]
MTSSNAPNFETIAKLLKKNYNFEWKLNQTVIRRKNLYSIKGRIENILVSNRQDVRLTLYIKKGGMKGEGMVPLIDFSADELRKAVSTARVLAVNAFNKDFPLPSRKPVKNVSYDKKIERIVETKAGDNILCRMHKSIMLTAKNARVIMNSHELHASVEERRVLNSKGQNVRQTKTMIQLESVCSLKKLGIEREVIVEEEVGALKQFNVKRIVQEQILLAKDVLVADSAPFFVGPVIVSGRALSDMFRPHLSIGPFVVHASAKIKYLNLSRYSKGQPIIGQAEHDKLTITSNPFLRDNPVSWAFDDDGTPSSKVVLVQNNFFKNYFGSQKFSHYIKEKPTGQLGVVEVKPGKCSSSAIRKGEHVEIVSFASFVPNDFNGDFSAEIRLGYLVSKTGKKKPFRGGMFTGNLFQLIRDCRLSSRVQEKSGYLGPDSVRFELGNVTAV